MASLLRKVKEHPHYIHLSKYKLAYMLGVLFIALSCFYYKLSGAEMVSRYLQVSSIVVPSCYVESSPTQLNFGMYKIPRFHQTEPEEASTAFVLHCNKGTVSSIAVGAGVHSINGHREMINAEGDYLAYDLYTNSSRKSSWEVNKEKIFQWQTSVPYSVIIYAYLPVGEKVNEGTYRDSISVTVRFYPNEIVETYSVPISITYLSKDAIDMHNLALKQ